MTLFPFQLPIDASKLDNEEMALVIKSFRQILKQRREKDYKPRSKKVCYKCGKPGHFIAKCPLSSDRDRDNDKKGKRREKKRYHKMFASIIDKSNVNCRNTPFLLISYISDML